MYDVTTNARVWHTARTLARGTLILWARGHLAQVALFCPEHDVKLLFVVWEFISRSSVLSYLPVVDLVPVSSRFDALSDSDSEHCIGNAIKMGEVQQPSVSSGSRCISKAW